MKRKNNRKLLTSVALGMAVLCTLTVPSAAIDSVSETSDSYSVSAAATDGLSAATRSAEARAFALPSGATVTALTVNGRRVLEGRVFTLGGTTYVPMFKFADWLGKFDYSGSYASGRLSGRIEGQSLRIDAVENNLYISANGRYFYTGSEVMNIGGELYIPIRPLVKALNCYVDYSASSGYTVRSGDTSLLKTDRQVYRDSDVYWLARIISAEAGGENFRGKMAVGNVVLNRMRSSQFPNSIYGVIFDKQYGVQFSPVANGTIYNEPTAESVIAAKVCLEGYSLSSEILYFFNPSVVTSSWISRTREYAFTIQHHAFYK